MTVTPRVDVAIPHTSAQPGPGSFVDLEIAEPRRRWAWVRHARNASRLALPLALLVIWQLLCSSGTIPPTKLDSPTTILSALADLARTGTLQESLAVSLHRAAVGFAYGAAIGLTAGLIAGMYGTGERALDALLQMLRTVPFLALIPLFVIWFGVGEQPKITLIAVACIFPIYLNTFAGIRGVDDRLLEATSVLGFTRIERLRHVVFPAALPQVLVGLRQSLGIAWLSLVVAEQLAVNSGLGFLINNAREFLQTNVIVVCLLVYAILGLVTDGLVRVLERRALAWRRPSRA